MDKLIQIVAVIVRIAAILLMIRGVSYLPNWYFSLSSGPVDSPIIFLTIGYCLFFIGGTIFLWKFPLSIARHIVPVGEYKELTSDLPLERLQAALLSVFGVGLVIYTVPDLIIKYTYLRNLKLASDPGYPVDDLWLYASLYQALVEVVIGIWLALGSGSIMRFINGLRYAGISK